MAPDKNDTRVYANREAALARVRGNEALYKRMLGLFLKSGEFAAFEQALTAGDYNRAADVAHAIKGISGNLSLDALFELSSKLMTELRRGAAPSQELLDDYRKSLDETTRIVREIVS